MEQCNGLDSLEEFGVAIVYKTKIQNPKNYSIFSVARNFSPEFPEKLAKIPTKFPTLPKFPHFGE